MGATVHMRACLAIALLGSTLYAPGAFPAERVWYTLTIDGERVGYGYREHRMEASEQIDSQLMRVDVAQFRRTSRVEERTQVVRGAAGQPRRIQVETISGIERSGWQGSFDAASALVTVFIEGVSGSQRIAVPEQLILPDQLDAALAPLWRDSQGQTQFLYLEPESAKPVRLTADRLPGSQTGRQSGLVAIRTTTDSSAASDKRTLWIDPSGTLRWMSQRFLGEELLWEPCPRDCDASVSKPFDLMARLVVQSPYRIPHGALAGPIRYVISRSDGAVPQLPMTGEQSVALDGSRAVVTVCATCGTSEAISDADRLRYLRANAWVQRDIPEVRSFAKRHSSSGPVERTMTQLVAAVRDHMNGDVDYLGYGTARDALRTRSGDCTEFSVLLAALARNRGIPARIAVGLVYSDRFTGKKDVFSPHTWVQAWTGTRWVSYDAGLGEFDATHIAIAVGDGDPRDMQMVSARVWRIERLGLVR